MPIYSVNFRLKRDATYDLRWTELVTRIRREALGGDTWEDLTSNTYLQSHKTADQLADSLSAGLLDLRSDLLFVLECDKQPYALRGHVDDPESMRAVLNLGFGMPYTPLANILANYPSFGGLRG